MIDLEDYGDVFSEIIINFAVQNRFSNDDNRKETRTKGTVRCREL